MPTYKNKTESTLVLPNIGEVKAGETITSEIPIFNSNLELIEAPKDQKAEPLKNLDN